MTDIADIKPDTSLYSTQGDRLRAMGAVADANDSGAVVQVRVRKEASHWEIMSHALVDSPTRFDYRIEPEPPEPPKPRELWCIETYTGDLYRDGDKPRIYTTEPVCVTGNKPVRFVEQL